MKLHTAIKYLNTLPQTPDRFIPQRWKAVSERLAEQLDIRLPKKITLGVTGRDREYVCSVISSAMNRAGQCCAVIDIDCSLRPDEILKIDGKPLSPDDIAAMITRVRAVAREAAAEDPEKYSGITVYEVLLLSALCECALLDVQNLIASVDFRRIPKGYSMPFLPISEMLVTAVEREEILCMGSVLKRGVGQVISTPQREDVLRELVTFCAAVNCSCGIIIRDHIQTGELTYNGLGFTYRGFSAVAGTCFGSLLGIPAAVAEALRALADQGIVIPDKQIADAINATKLSGRGELIAVHPLIVCAVSEPAEMEIDGVIASDLSPIAKPYGRSVAMLVSGSVAMAPGFSRQLDALAEDGCLPGTVSVVLTEGQTPEQMRLPEGFIKAGGSVVFSCDIRSGMMLFPATAARKLPEKEILLILGDRTFVKEATAQINAEIHRGLEF